VSHELSEAFSNPDGQGYSVDVGTTNCEIGDICEASATGSCCVTVPYTVSGRTWNVEQYWSNLDAKCIIGTSTQISAIRSSLACFGVSASASRVYYLDLKNIVNELSWQNRWVHNLLPAGVDLGPIAGTSLACFGVNGTDSRVYYLDSKNHVIELAWENGWRPPFDITAQTSAPAALSGSALACFGVNGTDSRVYYLDANHRVNELKWANGNWSHSQDILQAQQNAVQALNGSGLACFGVNGTDSRVYYLDSNNHVNELKWANGWSAPLDLTALAAASPATGSNAVACFGVNGTDSRVYFVDASFRVNELKWANGWSHPQEIVSAQNGTLHVRVGSALACFGVNNTDSRVYYIDLNSHVSELAWVNGWRPPFDFFAQAGAPLTENGSALACFGVNGSDSRVYYEDPTNHVDELAWHDNGWTVSIL